MDAAEIPPQAKMAAGSVAGARGTEAAATARRTEAAATATRMEAAGSVVMQV